MSRDLKIDDYQIVENLICKTLRRMKGGGRGRFMGVDTIAASQPLYRFVGDELKKYSVDGDVKVIDLDDMRVKNPPKLYAPQGICGGM